MNEKNAADKPNKFPGCDTDLPAGTAAVEHMAQCARLQSMIAVGRARYKAECKKDEDARTVKFRKRLERCKGNYFAPAQV
jgi:hypothetical protein